MFNYIMRRLLMIPLLLFGVTVLIFLMLQFLGPTQRSALYVRDIPRNERVLQGVIRKYGLDKPFYVQYWRWLVGVTDEKTGKHEGGILFGQFGYSRTASEPVIEIIKRRFPATLELALWSVLPVILGGVILGVVAAVNHNKFIDQMARVFSILGWSFPTFVFGLLMLMIFYAELKWFPPGRISDWADAVVRSPQFHNYTTMITFDALLNGRLDVFWDAFKHLILPITTLSYLNWALLLRVTRSSMLEVLRQDYITTARAKGLSERRVIFRHALPNALMPVVTIGGMMVVGLLNGVVITETVFNYPGMGKAAADAALNLDVVTVLGLTLFSGTLLIFSNLVVDIMYAYIDPRVRLE
ncbi:MAG TPA: ABC transporter permease [Chloroflexi bacterium]|nr:ABC transporter permease [Chloroflexota bacterium]